VPFTTFLVVSLLHKDLLSSSQKTIAGILIFIFIYSFLL